jgi:N-acetylneuraminic acid mutarotase
MRKQRLLTLLSVFVLGLLALAGAPAHAASEWGEKRPVLNNPPARSSHATAMGLNGRVVLFGGSDTGRTNTVLADTWEWDGTSWTNKTPANITAANNPPARASHRMATGLNGRVVLFGGAANDSSGNLAFLADTWEWDGTSWTKKTPATSPPARSSHAMATGLDGRVVLFGGSAGFDSSNNRIRFNDTWEWDGTNWTNKTPANPTFTTNPSARTAHAMATGLAGRVVLFGGSNGNNLRDTWEWDGTSWTRKPDAANTANNPPQRASHAMATGLNGRVVMFAGQGDSLSGPLADTWEWDGSLWTNKTPATIDATNNPRARSVHAMAMGLNGRAVLFGGAGGGTLDDTWEWDGTSWTNKSPANLKAIPPGRDSHGMATGLNGRVVMFGGFSNTFSILGDTWEWDGTSWTKKTPATITATNSPEARFLPAMAMGLNGRVVLFGGVAERSGVDVSLADTWEFDGTSWTKKTPATSPPNAGVMATGLNGRVVLYRGVQGAPETWEWDGTNWENKTPATNSPPARSRPAMATGLNGRVVLFGGQSPGGGALADTWEWDGTTWTNKTPATSPPARSSHAMAMGLNGRVVLFGGFGTSNGAGFRFNDTWEWDGTTWTNTTPATITAANNPPVRSSHAMATGLNGRVVMFGGSGSGSRFADTWEYFSNTSPTVASAIPDVVVNKDAPNTTIDLRTYFADAEDGAAGLVYTFSTNPNPTMLLSASINDATDVLTLDYAEGASGTLSITITATDPSGSTVQDTFTVTVNAASAPPVNAVPLAQTTPEDTPLVLSAAGNNALSVSDADSANLTVSLSLPSGTGTLSLSRTEGLTFTSGDGTADATMTFSGSADSINAALNGLRFDPTADFNGAATLTITSNDGALEDTDTVAITVAPVNDAPVALDDSASTQSGEADTVQVLVNDTDADGDALVVSAVDTTGTRGTVAISADSKSVVFTPEAGFLGDTSFGYTVSDGTTTDSARVSMQVLPRPNRAPVAFADIFNVSSAGARVLQVPAPGVLRNDRDADGDTLAARLATQPRNGRLTLNANGSFTYTPNVLFGGRDFFTYRAFDGEADSAPVTVTLNVPAALDITPPLVVLAGGAVRRLPLLPMARGVAVDLYATRENGIVVMSGLRSTVLRLQNGAGQFWNGRTFQVAPFDLPVSFTNTSFTAANEALPPRNARNSPDEAFTYTAIATDKAGNRSIARQTIVIDSTPPGLSITNPTLTDSLRNRSVVTSLSGIGGTVSGATRVDVLLRNSAGRFFNGTTFVENPAFLPATISGSSFTLDLPDGLNLAPGSYLISVLARDSAFNVTGASRILVVQSAPAS